MMETDAHPDVLDGSGAAKTESIRWVWFLILLALLSILIAVGAVTPPPTWNAGEVVLFVLTAFLFSLVAIFLAVSEYREGLGRTQAGVRPVAAQVRALQEVQTRLGDAVTQSQEQLATLAAQAERHQQEWESRLTGLASALQAVTAQVTALAEALPAQQQTTGAAVATLTDAHAQLTADVQRLQATLEAVAGGVTAITREQTDVRSALHEHGQTLRAAVEEMGQREAALQAGVDGLAGTGSQTATTIAALAATQGQWAGDVQRLQAALDAMAGGVTEMIREQAGVRDALQEHGRALAASAEATRQREATLQAGVDALSEAGRQTGTALAALAGTQGQSTDDIQKTQATLDAVAGMIRAMDCAQAGAHSAAQEMAQRTNEEVRGMAARQSAHGEAWQGRAEAVRTALAALGVGQEQLTGALQQLHASAQEVARVVAGTACETAATRGSLQALVTLPEELTALRAEQTAVREIVQTLGPEMTRFGTQQRALAEAVRSQERAISTVGAGLAAYEGRLGDDLRGLREVAQEIAGSVMEVGREQPAACGVIPEGRRTLTASLESDRTAPVTAFGSGGGPELQIVTPAAGEQGAFDVEPVAPEHGAEEDSLCLRAAQAIMHGKQIHYEVGPDRDCLGFRTSASDWAEWTVALARPGRFQVTAEIAAVAGARFQVTLGDQTLVGTAPSTGDYSRFERVELGCVALTAAGKMRVTVRPVPEGWRPMNLRSLDLGPLPA